MHRRSFLTGIAATGLMPSIARAAPSVLRAAPVSQQIVPARYGPSDLWAYNGQMPGTALRLRQGDDLTVQLDNALTQPTAIHWHGIRIDNAMDGVPGLTQAPVAPGETFDYRFALPDAGTYWYHSHARSMEQVERGLYGPLIVEEASDAPDVDHDMTLVIDDIRLDADAKLAQPLDHRHDRSHAGRLGNVFVVNGQVEPAFALRRGDRARLRLISAANARIFRLGLVGLEGVTVALDGMPLDSPQPIEGPIVLAPAQRADLIVDVVSDEAEAFLVSYERDGGYALASFPLSGPAAARRPAASALPPNPHFAIDLDAARTTTLLMEGGAMGMMQSALLDGVETDMRSLAQANKFWAFNGQVGEMDSYGQGDPLLSLALGETARIGIANDTAFAHAMHMHGMHFSEVTRDGALGPLRDTMLIGPRETREIAFAAHNPGDWLFHCHMLSHHAAGMGTWIRVNA